MYFLEEVLGVFFWGEGLCVGVVIFLWFVMKVLMRMIKLVMYVVVLRMMIRLFLCGRFMFNVRNMVMVCLGIVLVFFSERWYGW